MSNDDGSTPGGPTATATAGDHFEVFDPTDGRVLDLVHAAGEAEVRATAERLRAAQRGWVDLTVTQRVHWVRRYRDWLLDHEDELLALVHQETGKPSAELGIEIGSSVAVIHYYADHAEEFLADDTPRPSSPLTAIKRFRVRHVPYPLVGIISPWNAPLSMFLWDAVPALLAGAAVLVKPSEHTPLAAAAAIAGWTEIGAPPVLAAVQGAGATGSAVVDAVDYVHFTGSTRTGTAIATQAASQLKPFSLELGGKDPAVVLPDADLAAAAAGIVFTAMVNSGQVCVAVERVYVHADVYDAFVAQVLERVRALRQHGDGYDSDLSVLITPQQLEIVTAHVADAVTKGARVECGGEPTGVGLGFAPTVLTGVDHTMRVMTEETFGPVLPIMRVESVDEAVRLANDSAFGLSASVWGRDRTRARAVAERLEAGTVNINDGVTHLLCHPIPQSGWKSSGMGARFGGRNGMLKYTQSQAITENRVEVSVIGTLAGFPYAGSKNAVLRTAGRLIDGGSLRARLGGRALGEQHPCRVERDIAAPPSAVFAWLEDGHHIARAMPTPAVMVERERGRESRFGVGAVRDIVLPVGFVRERITVHRPDEALGYVITAAFPPLPHVGADIALESLDDGGTRVVWTSQFALPAVGQHALNLAFAQVFGRILAACARDLES